MPLLALYLFYRQTAIPLGVPRVRWHDDVLLRVEWAWWTSSWTIPIPWIADWLAIAYHAFVPLLALAAAVAFWPGDSAGERRMARTVGTICVAWAVCDVVFVMFPVEGPRFVIPGLQAARMGDGILARFASFYQENGMIRGGAFPSAHVAGAVVAMAALWRRRSAFVAALPVAISLGAGAVYYGYHYASDVIVGAAVGGAVLGGVAWFRRGRTNLEGARSEPV